MKINLEKTSDVERKLSVEIPWDTVKEEIDKALFRIRAGATLKGFRKGKAPIEMVRKIYGAEAKDDAVNSLVSVATRKALDENNLIPFGSPYLTEVKSDENKPLGFEAIVELSPSFELTDYKGLELEKPIFRVKDEDVTSFIDSLREQKAEAVPVEENRELCSGDIARIDFSGTKGGEPVEGMDVKDYMIQIGKTELVPGFEAQILGMKAGEEKEFDLPFPDDFSNKDLAGRTVHFSVAIKAIEVLDIPDLDDEFASTVGEYRTVDELRKAVREDMEKIRGTDSERALRSNLTRKLVDANVFDVPPSLVDKELRFLVQDYGEKLTRAGVPDEKIKELILANEEGLKDTAKEHVRLMYVISEIADVEKIEAKDAEIDAVVRHAAAQTGKRYEDLQEEYSSDGTIKEITFSILRDKVFNHILENAVITETEAKNEIEQEDH
ncbi:MAG: trigger factor [Deltaproteobacteria bacterium]|nr:trigger factor [Deltaproteobacteria bacterium]